MELSFDPSELQPLGEYHFKRNFNKREAREWCGRIGERGGCGSGASWTPGSPIGFCCF